MATTKDLRQQWQSARKSAPVSAGGVNVRRLALHGLTAKSTRQDACDEEQEDSAQDETTRSAACGNPFCRKVLANRYASFCEDKRMCQRYRALKLQCLANAQAEEDEEDTKPLSLVIKRRKRKDKSNDTQTPAEVQASPRATGHNNGRKNKGLTVARVAAGAEASDEKRRSSVKSPRESEKEATPRKKKRKKVVRQMDSEQAADDVDEEEEEGEKEAEDEGEEKKKRDKRVKRTRDGQEMDSLVGRLRSGGLTPSSVSAVDELGAHTDKAAKKTLLRVQLSTETSGDGKPGIGSSSLRVKRRRLDGRLSTGKAASPRFVSSSPKHVATPPAASSADASWTIPRATPSQERTSVQQIRRNMDADLVPLGVAKSAKSTGGGRYVQNGNRSVSNGLRPSNPRPRPLSMSKFPVLPVSAAPASSVLPAKALPTFVSTTRQQPSSPQYKRPWPPLPPQASVAAPTPLPHQTSVMAPPPPPPPPRQTSVTAPLPPPPLLPPQTFVSAPLPVSRPAARTVTSSPLSAKSFAAPAAIDLPATTAPAACDVSRISTLAYLKSKKGVSERQLPGHQTNFPPPRMSSPERVSIVSDDHALGISMVPACPTGPPRYRNDGAPLLSYAESRLVVDTRRHYPEVDAKNQRSHSGAEEDAMQYRERPKVGSALERSASGHWKDRNFLSPRERTLLRQQDAFTAGVRSSGFEYSTDTYVRSSPSSYEQPNRKKPAHKEPPPPQHASASCRSDQRVNHEPRKSGHDDIEDDAPTFSYRESFLPHLLSVFIYKFPHSLEAVYNVTKKPRKMIWYVKTIERIERMCRPFDLKVKFDGLKAVVTVRDREWLTLEGTSTVLLHLDVMKGLRSEAITWLRLYEEMETALAYYRSMYGSQANESYCFLRAWNNLKSTGNPIALSREVNYFCGTRFHHWNFVVGKVEIGSGSHEEKREAFRLATISALYFLLSIGRGVRRPSVERTRASDDHDDFEESHRSSSREPSASRTVRSPDDNRENSVSAASSPSIGPSSPVESRQAVVQPPTKRLPMARDDATRFFAEAPSTGRQPSPVQPSTEQLPVARDDATRSPAEAPSTGRQPSPVQPSMEQLPAPRDGADSLRADKPSTTQGPAEDESLFSAEVHSDTAPVSSGSHELAETVEKRCPSKEMDTSDVNATGVSSSAESPRIPVRTRGTSYANAREPAATPVSGVTSGGTVSSAPTVVVSGPTITLDPLRPAVAVQSEPLAFIPAPIMAPFGAPAAAAGNMGPAIQRGIPAFQTKASAPSRRCMMCEMIRMRKPDGERCLRCQQKDVPANGAFSALLWP